MFNLFLRVILNYFFKRFPSFPAELVSTGIFLSTFLTEHCSQIIEYVFSILGLRSCHYRVINLIFAFGCPIRKARVCSNVAISKSLRVFCCDRDNNILKSDYDLPTIHALPANRNEIEKPINFFTGHTISGSYVWFCPGACRPGVWYP